MSAAEAGWAEPVALCVAPNGARRTKADHPALPITPAELAATAEAALAAGAAMIHLHVRDENDRHSIDADRYRRAVDAVREAVGERMVIQITTEAVGVFTPEQQMATVRAVKPEAVSLALRELIPDAAHEGAAAEFLAWCLGEGVHPQYIVYEAAEVTRLRDLHARGVIPGRSPQRLYVLGRYTAGQRSHPRDLLPFLNADLDDRGESAGPWSLCAFGAKEAACATAAASLGGHVRIGFENNLHRPDGDLAAGNADLVAAAAAGARAIGRPLADAAWLREAMAAWDAPG